MQISLSAGGSPSHTLGTIRQQAVSQTQFADVAEQRAADAVVFGIAKAFEREPDTSSVSVSASVYVNISRSVEPS